MRCYGNGVFLIVYDITFFTNCTPGMRVIENEEYAGLYFCQDGERA
jgi:hypothetical protein